MRRRAVVLWILSTVAAAAGAAFAHSAPAASNPSPTAPAASAVTTVKRVTVTGRKDEVRITADKRSYDITGDLHAATGSVADALRDIPSVEVSPEGKVSLRGDQSVVIYVDGKPSTLFSGPQSAQALQTIPADQYERVEVMTSPSAAYAPDGSAGIINLVSKKTAKPGGSGSVRVTEGSRQESASVMANRKSGKLTLGFYGSLGRDWRIFTSEGLSQTLDASGDPLSTLSTAFRSSTRTDWGYTHDNFEWNPDPKTQLSGEVSALAAQAHGAMTNRFVAEDGAGATDQRLNRDGGSEHSYAYVHGDLTLRRNFEGDGHTLVLSLTQEYTPSRNQEADTFKSLLPPAPDSYENLVNSDASTQTELKGDYTRPMPSKAVLETGFDIKSDSDDSDHSGFLNAPVPTAPNDPGQTDRFRFKRRISAVYATWDQPLGKFDAKLGLRWEATDIDLNDVTTDYAARRRDDRLYPTLNLSYDLTDRQKLRAAYSERVQRPEAFQYDPFRFVYSPFNIRQGNPDLQLQQTQKFEIGWEYKHGDTYYRATAYYQQDSGGVTDVPINLGDNVILTRPENLVRASDTGLELGGSGRLWKKLKYNFGGEILRNEFDAAGLGLGAPQAGWTAFGHASLDWDIGPKDFLQLQGDMSSKRLRAIGYFEPEPQMSLGFRHKFSDRLALTLTGNDVLGTSGFRFATDTPTIRGIGRYKPHMQTAILSLSWSFGAGPKRDPEFDYGASH